MAVGQLAAQLLGQGGIRRQQRWRGLARNVLRFGLHLQHQVVRVLVAQGPLHRVDDELRLGHALALSGKLQLLFEQGIHANRDGHDVLRRKMNTVLLYHNLRFSPS